MLHLHNIILAMLHLYTIIVAIKFTHNTISYVIFIHYNISYVKFIHYNVTNGYHVSILHTLYGYITIKPYRMYEKSIVKYQFLVSKIYTTVIVYI